MFRFRLLDRGRRTRAVMTVTAVVAGVMTGVLAGGAAGHAAVRTFSGIGVTADGSGYGLISRAGYAMPTS